MTKSIIYAASSYAELRRDNGYFVDKTEYIAKLQYLRQNCKREKKLVK